jgi:hypothetical protein
MFKFEVVELAFKCLVLACLTGVVFFGEDALPTGDAGREVTSTFTAVDVATEITI